MTHVANWKPEKGSHKRAKAKAVRVQRKADRSVYALVTARDGNRCRVCGDSREVHRHHLKGRMFTTTRDVVCLCAKHHGDLHPRVGGIRLRISGNADQVKGLAVEVKIRGAWWPWGKV